MNHNYFSTNCRGVDLNADTTLSNPQETTSLRMHHVHWQNTVCAADGLFTLDNLHANRRQVRRKSSNAVKVQIWTAVSMYVLVAIIKKRLNLDASLYTLLQVFSVTLFEKIPLNKGFLDKSHGTEDGIFTNQLNLFNN